MLSFLQTHWADIILCALLAAGLALALLRMAKNRRRGRHSCGGGCSGCPMAGGCTQGEQSRRC